MTTVLSGVQTQSLCIYDSPIPPGIEAVLWRVQRCEHELMGKENSQKNKQLNKNTVTIFLFTELNCISNTSHQHLQSLPEKYQAINLKKMYKGK